jgi:hypothetical protein
MTLFAGLLHSVRNDAAHVSVIANPQGEAIQNTDNEAERIHVNPQAEAISGKG